MAEEDTERSDYKELVDFNEVIGLYVNPKTTIAQRTTRGIIHHCKNGQSYIIPAAPDENIFAQQDIFSEEIEERCLILLSVQRSLVGAVTRHLRAVFIDWIHNNKKLFIKLYFVLEKESDVDCEEAEAVAAEVVANFVNAQIETEFVIIDCIQPVPSFGKVCVFQRKE